MLILFIINVYFFFKMKKNILVSIVMGSQSDWKVLSSTEKILKDFDITHEKKIVSAHRTPDRLY